MPDEAEIQAGMKALEIVKPISFGLMVFLSIVAWSFFLATAPQQDLGMKVVVDTILAKGVLDGTLELLGKVFSLQFMLFTLLLPLTLALVGVLPFYYSRIKAYAIALGSSFLALLAIIALLGFIKLGILTAFFFGLGIVAMLEAVRLKKDELKRFVGFRAVASSGKTCLLILSIGVLLATSYTAYRDNDANTKKIGEELIAIAFKPGIGQSGLTEKVADLVLESQKQGYLLIYSTPQFQKLREKADPDVAAYVLLVDVARQGFDSPETRQKTIELLNSQLENAQGGQVLQKGFGADKLITIDTLRKQSPIMDLVFRYYWLLFAFGVWTTFLMFANLVLANLGGAYAAIIRKMMELLSKTSGQGKPAG